MYAIVETGGKQYRVQKNNVIAVEKIAAECEEEVILDKVLLFSGDELKIGTPYVQDVTVKAKVVAQGRKPKVLVFKRRRRKDSKTLHGHRQDYTMLEINEINVGNQESAD